jgi:nitrate/nitrite transporter NarK
MKPNIRRLYLYHFFNTIAITVVSNYVFLDKLFLRMGLSMGQFGVIKGVSWFFPMLLNFLLSPFLLRLNKDRIIVATGYVLRVTIPFLLLLLPILTQDPAMKTLGVVIILLFAHVPPILANNSVQALIKVHIPKDELGHHLSRITLLWTLPGLLLAIPLSRYLDTFSAASDREFYAALFRIMLATAVFQSLSSFFILRIDKPGPLSQEAKKAGFKAILDPFMDPPFRSLMNVALIYGIITFMVSSFINPFLIEGHGLSLGYISTISAGVSLLSVVLLPLWGRMCDRIGGRNIYRITVVGLALGIFALTGNGIGYVLLFAVFSWDGGRGIFGTGISTAQQYLTILLSNEKKSNIYLAAVTFSTGCGYLIGALLGGQLLEWIKLRINPDPAFAADYYKIYYMLVGAMCLLLSQIALSIQDKHRPLKPHEVGMEMYRSVRSLFGRVR